MRKGISQLSLKTKQENWKIFRLRGMIADSSILLSPRAAHIVKSFCNAVIYDIQFNQRQRKVKK